MKSRKLRVAVIGTGSIGRGVHVPAWKRITDVEIVAVADIRKERAVTTAAEHGIPNVYRDYRDVCAMREVDAVDVCTPNKLHAPIALAALAAGKHVLCEKPLAPSPSEVEAMIRGAKKARRLLCSVQNHRFRPESVALKQYIDAGRLGRTYYARAWAIRRNLLPPASTFISRKESGGGPCFDIGVHVLDVTMWLMGFPQPESVSGVAQTNLAKSRIIPSIWGDWDRKKYDVEDFAVGLVRFHNGVTLTLEASWLGHLPEPERFCSTVLGTHAGVSWPSCEVCTADRGILVDAKLKPKEAPFNSHETQLRAFVDAVVNGKSAPVPLEQTLTVIRILDAIYRSQKTGREVRL
jgi:predicted dehydrogenase